jgi:cytohesin
VAFAGPVPAVLSRNDSLLLAAATNDVPLAQRLLAHGAAVNYQYADTLSSRDFPSHLALPNWEQVPIGDAALHVAVARGHLAMTDFLLRHGADPRRPGYSGKPLDQAIGYVPNQVAMVQRLLATGLPLDSLLADPGALVAVIQYNAAMRNLQARYAPGSAAALADGRRSRRNQMGPRHRYRPTLYPLRPDSVNLRLLELLLRAGARTDSTAGTLPLHAAILAPEPVLLRYLLTHGASVEARDNYGQTALHLAVQRRDTALVELLLGQGARPNTPDAAGYTPVHLATAAGSPRLLATLLRAGGDVSSRTSCRPDCYAMHEGPRGRDGWYSTPLHLAAEMGNLAVTELLLAAGAAVNARGDDLETPLLLAVGYRPADAAMYLPRSKAAGLATQAEGYAVVRRLLAAGANPSLADGTGRTPLHYAVERNDTLLVGLLLRHGALPNLLDNQGMTPLVRVSSAAVLRQLLAAGAQFGDMASTVLFNPQVAPAVAAAALAGGADLLEISSDCETPLHLIAVDTDSNLETVLVYLAHGARLELTDVGENTPLARAATGRLALVHLLLDAGADPNGAPGASPLAHAAAAGNEAVLRELLACGARLNAPDHAEGALLAALRSGIGSPAVVQLLLAAGADPNLPDEEGNTALHRCVAGLHEFSPPDNDGWQDPTPTQVQAAASATAAVEARFLVVARLLLAHGARLDSRNTAGQSVLDALHATKVPAARQLLAELEKPEKSVRERIH